MSCAAWLCSFSIVFAECYDTIAAEIKKPEVDGEKCAKKMENMLTAMKVCFDCCAIRCC